MEFFRTINHYSFIFGALLGFGILMALMLRRGFQSTDLIALGALLFGLVFAAYLLNPGKSTLHLAEAVRDQIGSGEPVLLEFQSPY